MEGAGVQALAFYFMPFKNIEEKRAYYRKYNSLRKEKSKSWWTKNKGIHRKYNAKRNYGLTLEEYENIISRGCYICGTKEGRLCVDHCHESGIVRGCLCQKHNTALEFLHESPAEVIKMYNYIVNVCQPIKEKAKCPIPLHN